MIFGPRQGPECFLSLRFSDVPDRISPSLYERGRGRDLRNTPSLANDIAIRILPNGEPITSSWRLIDRGNISEAAEMSLLFYLTLFIVMCVFGWSVKGAG